jgi:superfamily II DNA or RNA helicase
MTGIPTLRPYQARTVDAIFDAWDGGMDRPAISIATGGGKSVVFGAVAREHLAHHRDQGPACLIAHRRELVTQAAGHFSRANPDLRVEVALGNPGPFGSTKRAKTLRDWRRADVLVSSVQTLASPSTSDVFPDPSLVIADEAHHAAAKQWTKVLTQLGAFSGTRALGVTATPFREDHREFSDIWQAIVASVDIAWLISHGQDADGAEIEVEPGHGYLIPPTLRHLLVDGLDLSRVPTSKRSGAVDFRDGELAEAMAESGAFDLVAKTILDELADRKGVIFAPTVASSQYLAQVLTDAGAPCHHVDGTMGTPERDRIIGDFRDNRVRWLSNVNIVSEGFDIPEIDSVVLARPTQSRIFFRQAIGRALRPSPGKRDAIVLDVAGASDGHSLAGVSALTDADVLDAERDEELVELLARSGRERRGRYDRIQAHRGDARDIQERAERAAEQVRLTAEGVGDALPGVMEFAQRVPPILAEVLDYAVGALDRASAARPDETLDALAATERTCAEEVGAARTALGRLEALKTVLREALASLREEPASEMARAMVTGTVATVRGDLFGEEEERYRPGAPASVTKLKVRGAAREERPVHPQRYGWAMRTTGGAYFALVHGEGAQAPATVASHTLSSPARSEPTAMAVAVPLGHVEGEHGATRFLPVWWDLRTGEARELAAAEGEEEAYRRIINAAADETVAPNLLNPAAAWRKKPSPAGNGARAMARRVAPTHDIPDNATAGYVSDTITYGKHAAQVEKLAAWVQQQTGAAS